MVLPPLSVVTTKLRDLQARETVESPSTVLFVRVLLLPLRKSLYSLSRSAAAEKLLKVTGAAAEVTGYTATYIREKPFQAVR